MIDTAFVGRCAGTLDLAALGPSSTVTDLIYLICSSISTVAIKQYAERAGSEESRTRHHATIIFVGLLLGTCGSIFTFKAARGLLHALGATRAMMPVAMDFALVRALGLPIATISSGLYGLCVGQGDTKTPFFVTVALTSVLNIAFTWFCCAVLGLGAAGAAWATVASQMTSFIAYIVIMRRKGLLPLPPARSFLPRMKDIKPVLGMILPISFIIICILSMYVCMSGFVNRSQPLQMIAAYKVFISIFAFVALLADPMAAAVTSQLPAFVLAGRSACANLFMKRAMLCALAVGTVGAAAGSFSLRFASSLFTADPIVAAGSRIGLWHFAAIILVMHPTRVCQNALVAHGDLLFYVLAQAGLSTLFFATLQLVLHLPCSATPVGAYLSMWSATLLFYTSSFTVYGGRMCILNGRLRPS
eukprot:TRINITY_DN10835_c0_g1_i2.p1 TRINITY_DN10835_c0_g1~~TRINITY_DN10835_c0_g1_i2.p1  ORF type:complete len:417 (-),score=52.32 TRINITY_DN10835_c0_g1_i2:74-1324(-)